MGNNDFYKRFGRTAARLRGARKKTQAEVARELGISRASLANIERGEQRIYLHQVVQLAKALSCQDLSDLVPSAIRSVGPLPADVTLSGDKVNRVEGLAIRKLVTAITASTRKSV